MTDIILDRATGPAAARAATDLYRAVWRWHFYAGLLVLPFLITLAVTGALYLFRDEIDAIVHSDLKEVAVQAERAAPAAMIAAATARYPGTAIKLTTPRSPTSSAEITVKTDAGEKLAVYVDPYSGAVLGALPNEGTIMWFVRSLHSLDYFGAIGRAAIEIAGGWAILLVGTGIYLWWPRKGRGGVVSVRGTPRQRIFWRDLHAVTGIFVGGFILFLAVTGMPWSVFWGDKVNGWVNGSNFGYPSGVFVDAPMSNEHLGHVTQAGWSMQQATLPESPSRGPNAIGVDQAVATFDRLGMAAGYAVNLPTTPEGVYTASVFPDDAARQRTVHLDQYSGAPLMDIPFASYGPTAKAIEWGVSVHLGQQYGRLNQIVMLGACIAIVVLAVGAAMMWWKRRPAGGFGVPPLPDDRRKLGSVLAILAVGGIVYPLVGASLVVLLAVDWLVTRRRRAVAA